MEVVIAVGIISIALFSLAGVSGTALRISEENAKNFQADFLLEEGMEAARVLRDSSWNRNIVPLSIGTNYYLNFSNNEWQATTTPSAFVDGIFARSFSFQSVYRDVNDDIVSSGGILDSNTKKITVSVSWFSRNATTTKSISTYITNFLKN